MNRHILSLEIPLTTNEGIFRLDDTSIYATDIPVSCPNVQILPPGFGVPASIDPLQSGFRLILNSCTLGISPIGDCSQLLPNIPDGLYHIRYSVSPNDKVYVEYDHLRTVKAMNRYYALLCAVNLQCCLPSKETEETLRELDIIHNYILGAKVTVENCHNQEDGINLLRYANNLMDKMSSKRSYC